MELVPQKPASQQASVDLAETFEHGVLLVNRKLETNPSASELADVVNFANFVGVRQTARAAVFTHVGLGKARILVEHTLGVET